MRGRKPGLDTIRRRIAATTNDDPPDCPPWLDGDARDEWDRVALLLRDVLRSADAVPLAAYCQAYSQWKKAEERVRLDGLMIEGARGCLVLHPCARLSTTLLAELRRCAAEFGLTPAARARVDAPPKQNGEQDAFDDFVGAE